MVPSKAVARMVTPVQTVRAWPLPTLPHAEILSAPHAVHPCHLFYLCLAGGHELSQPLEIVEASDCTGPPLFTVSFTMRTGASARCHAAMGGDQRP